MQQPALQESALFFHDINFVLKVEAIKERKSMHEVQLSPEEQLEDELDRDSLWLRFGATHLLYTGTNVQFV